MSTRLVDTEPSTTPLVSKIIQPGIILEYEYDGVWNTTKEMRRANASDTGHAITYAYDGLGQLVCVNDPHQSATWIYTYDQGGNIMNKSKYAYTTGMLGSVLESIAYTYGDPNWKGQEKVKYLEDELERRGYRVDTAAIEAAVRVMNLESGWIQKQSEKTC